MNCYLVWIEGRGDVVMGNLTITPARQKLVDFGPPLHPNVDELVITGPAAKNTASFDDLVKTGLYVRRSSSYFEHLQALNAERKTQGKKPIPVTEADENLEDYDLLDMVNAGVIKAIVVDSHKATFWEQVFDKIKVHRDLSVHSGNQIAWAIRKDSPGLMKSITAFGKTVKKGSLLGNIVLKRYLGNTRWIKNALVGKDRKRYEDTIEIIKRYAGQYEFDWLVIAGPGLPGIALRPEQAELGGRGGRHATTAQHRGGQGGRHPRCFDAGEQCPRRSEIPELAATNILHRRDDFAARPGAVLIRRIQRRPGAI